MAGSTAGNSKRVKGAPHSGCSNGPGQLAIAPAAIPLEVSPRGQLQQRLGGDVQGGQCCHPCQPKPAPRQAQHQCSSAATNNRKRSAASASPKPPWREQATSHSHQANPTSNHPVRSQCQSRVTPLRMRKQTAGDHHQHVRDRRPCSRNTGQIRTQSDREPVQRGQHDSNPVRRARRAGRRRWPCRTASPATARLRRAPHVERRPGQATNRRGQGPGGIRLDVDCTIARDLGQRATAGADQGRAIRHGFQRRQTEWLRPPAGTTAIEARPIRSMAAS